MVGRLCKGPESKYFQICCRLHSLCYYWAALVEWKQWRLTYKWNELAVPIQLYLYTLKFEFHNFCKSKWFFLFPLQPIKNAKSILCLRALLKQAMGQIWPVGHGADLGADLCGKVSLPWPLVLPVSVILKIHPRLLFYATLKSLLFTFTYPVKLKNTFYLSVLLKPFRY